MMPPMFGQPWRQAMQAPQQSPMQSGSMFPTRGPGGGWQMPAQMRPTPQAQPAPQAPPMMGQAQSGPIQFAPDLAKMLQGMQGMNMGFGLGNGGADTGGLGLGMGTGMGGVAGGASGMGGWGWGW